MGRKRGGTRLKPRTTEEEIARILSLIGEFGAGRRSKVLTWECLSELTNRPRRTLIRNDTIYKAYWQAKKATGKISAARRGRRGSAYENALMEKIARLNADIEDLKKQRDRSDEKLAAFIDAAERRGFNTRELADATLQSPPLGRTRRGKRRRLPRG